jgi:hypothetical protein
VRAGKSSGRLWQSRTGLKEPVLDLARPIRQLTHHRLSTDAVFAAIKTR